MVRHKKQDITKKGAPEWMNTYGDLVTLLLCFFVLLFSMSSIDVAKFKAMINSFDEHIGLLPGGKAIDEGILINNGISQIDEIAMYFEENKNTSLNEKKEESSEQVNNINKNIANRISEHLNNNQVGNDVKVTYTAQYVLLSLNGSTLFDSGEAQIKNNSIKLLNTIADVLKNYKQYSIAIEGHTDNRPINTKEFPSNMYLSSARAIQVYEFLVKKSFDPKKMFAVGYGEYRPVASNSKEKDRSKNRRVEIKIINSINLK